MHFTGVRNGFERSADLTYFVHVLDGSGKLLWQQDQPPRVNTRWWDEGDDIIERLPIKRPAAAARILLGWYAPGGERLPALRDGVLQQDGLLTLWTAP